MRCAARCLCVCCCRAAVAGGQPMSGKAVATGLVGALCVAITIVGIHPIYIANRELSAQSQVSVAARLCCVCCVC